MRLLCVALLLAACASNPAPHDGALIVNIVSDAAPVVRGYELQRVPELLEKQLRQELGTTRGTLEVRLVNDSYVFPPSTPPSRASEPELTIAWFAVEFTLKDSAGQTVKTGRVSADGPEPVSFGSIQTSEFAVIKQVVWRIRKSIA
jgi:hypothetical protein